MTTFKEKSWFFLSKISKRYLITYMIPEWDNPEWIFRYRYSWKKKLFHKLKSTCKIIYETQITKKSFFDGVSAILDQKVLLRTISGQYERVKCNQRNSLSAAGKVPYTFWAEKSDQECGLSVQTEQDVARVFSQAIIIKPLVFFCT